MPPMDAISVAFDFPLPSCKPGRGLGDLLADAGGVEVGVRCFENCNDIFHSIQRYT